MSSKIIEQLNWRYATKSFDTTRELSDSQLNTLTESLRLSPSSFGLQPWKFIIIKNKGLQKKLREHSWNQPQIEEASHLIVLCGLKNMGDAQVDAYLEDTARIRNVPIESLSDYGDMMKGFLARMDEPRKTSWIKNQVYIALGTLLTAAASEGIDACPIEGFLPSKYDAELGLDKLGLTSTVVCPVGFRSPNDKYAELTKVRFPAEQVFINM